MPGIKIRSETGYKRMQKAYCNLKITDNSMIVLKGGYDVKDNAISCFTAFTMMFAQPFIFLGNLACLISSLIPTIYIKKKVKNV